VYGSFPFWDRGYDILARSPGCRPEWLDAFRLACQRFGERPRDVGEAGGLFARRIERGPWMVVGVGTSGADDRGRPGALAFHALFVSPRDYRRIGGTPFGLADFHRRDWGPHPESLDDLTISVEVSASSDLPISGRAWRISEALGRGRRVAVESPGPIDDLAREVWAALSPKVRGRLSIATWAFGNANRFDLVAVPRLSGADVDEYYLDETGLDAPAESSPPPVAPTTKEPRFPASKSWGLARRPLLLMAGVVVLLVTAVALRGSNPQNWVPAAEPVGEAAGPTPRLAIPEPPNPAGYRDEPIDPDLRSRVVADLVEMAERFGAVDPGELADVADPVGVMTRISERIRYRGPVLSPEGLDALRSGTAPGRARALAWDAHVRLFVPDRPLPSGFSRGPLRWQLDTLAWSFHMEPDPGLATVEVPHALAHALAFEGSESANPLEARFPVLGDYRRFLAGLPAR
jgi:hypothetical protein